MSRDAAVARVSKSERSQYLGENSTRKGRIPIIDEWLNRIGKGWQRLIEDVPIEITQPCDNEYDKLSVMEFSLKL